MSILDTILDIATLGLWDNVLEWLMPDVKTNRQGIKVERQGADESIPVVYGTQKVGAIKVHKYVTDTPEEADNDLLHLICVFAEGECDQIQELFFNGKSENDPKWNGGSLSSGKWFKAYRYNGSEGQPASAAAVSGIPNWTIDHKLDGLCYAYIVCQLPYEESEVRGSIWRGEPKIQAIIRGKRILDTRTGVTAYSENPAMCLRDYLANDIYGWGLPPSRLVDSSFNAVADACDEGVQSTVTTTSYTVDRSVPGEPAYRPNVATTTETLPRFSTNMIIDTTQNAFDNVKELLSCFRGILPLSAGAIKINYETSGAPVFIFDDDNIDMDSAIDVDSGQINDRANRVEIRFPNKAKEYETDSVFFPADDDPLYAQWLEEDAGIKLDKSIEFPGISSKAEALQMAEIVAKKSRFTKSVSLVSQAIGLIVEPGDIVGLTNATHGWTEKPFRVIEKEVQPDDNVSFKLLEHEDTVYPWSGATFDELSGGTWLGDPNDLAAPSGLLITQDSTLSKTGVFEWSVIDNAFVDSYGVLVEKTADANGDPVTPAQRVYATKVQGNSWPIPLLDSGQYTLKVRAISTTGYPSPYAAIAVTLAEPVQPSSIVTVVSDWQIEARPQLAGIGLGTVFEFDIVEGDGAGYTPTSRGRASTFTFTGLLPDSQYTVYARSVNAYGESAWTSTTTSTTNTGAQVDEFLDPIKDDLDILNNELDSADLILEQVAQDIEEVYNRSSVEDRVRKAETITLETTQQLVDEYLDTLNQETLPELNSRLTAAEGDIDTLETVTVPEINGIIDQVQDDITVINGTTIPQVQSDLNDVDTRLDDVNNIIEPLTGQVPSTIDNALEQVAQDVAEIYDRTDGVRGVADGLVLANDKIETLNSSTLPQLQIDLSEANNEIDSLQGLFPIQETSISDSAITTPKLSANAVTADKILAGAVTTNKMTANSISGDRIAANTMAADKLVANSLTAAQIAAAAITADEIDANAVTTQKIAALAVNADKIAANSIIADKIATNAVTAIKIAAGSISTDKLDALAVTAAKIAASAVVADKIAVNAITTDKLSANAVTAAKIAALTITGNEIQANTINAADKLVADSITAAQIAALTITGDEIAGRTVSADKIVANSITADEIAARTIVAANMVAGTITANEIATRTIQAVNIATDSITATEIKAGTITADEIAALTITGDKIVGRTIGADKLVANSITADEIAALTITASQLAANSITGEKITADAIDGKTITGVSIVGGTIQTIGANTMIIRSGNPFGPNNLIEWKGPTAGNVSGGQAILSNLTKVNAIGWTDDQNNQYTSGTIIAGTLTVSKQSTSLDSYTWVETGMFNSNGGQIAIQSSFFGSKSNGLQTGSCPVTEPSNPTVTMRLYRLEPNGTVLVAQESFTGEYICLDEGTEYTESWQINGSMTFYDNLGTTQNRNYRLEATVNDFPVLPDGTQRLSILTQEA